MSELHYFPRYSQKENFVTNNSLLLLNRIYQFDRYKFQRLLSELDPESELSFIGTGLQFSQQRSQGKRVVDGFLSQPSLKLGIETKLGDDFGIDQLRGHADGLGAADLKILVLLSPVGEAVKSIDLASFRLEMADRGIELLCVSFERLVDCARANLADYDEEMHLLVDDFAGFCSENGLLPSDGYTLLVPPCRQSFGENIEHKLYYCPVGRINRNPRYLGLYAWRSVRNIGVIAKRVRFSIADDSTVEADLPLSDQEKLRILGAHSDALKRGWSLATGSEVFLCDELFETDYQKPTKGGIQGFQYHDLRQLLGVQSMPPVQEIAERIRGLKWLSRS